MGTTPTPHSAIAGLVPSKVVYDTLRVTAQAKMTNLIAFALEKLQSLESRPMLFHSFPSPSDPTSTAPILPSEIATTSTPLDMDNPPAAPEGPAAIPHIHELNPVVTTPPTSTAIPKLISIVEIVKRTYVAPPPPARETEEDVEMAEEAGTTTSRRRKKGKGKALVVGLHQYTRLGSLESIGLTGEDIAEDEEAEEEIERKRQEKVALNWIESGAGRSKRPRRKHSPYMLIVLSRSRLQALDSDSAWSYQPPNRPPPAAKPDKPITKNEKATEPVQQVAAETEEVEAAVVDAGAEKKTKHSRKRKRPRSKLLTGKDDAVGDAVGDAMDVSTTSLTVGAGEVTMA